VQGKDDSPRLTGAIDVGSTCTAAPRSFSRTACTVLLRYAVVTGGQHRLAVGQSRVSSRWDVMDTSDVIAAASAVIAIASLTVSIYQLTAAMKHNRQSVRPVLQMGSTFRAGSRSGLNLVNCGLGPAVITGSRVELDGEYIGEYGEDTVNRIRGDDRPRPSAVTFGTATGTVLPAGYEEMLLSVDHFD